MRKLAIYVALLATPWLASGANAQSLTPKPPVSSGPVAVGGIDTTRNGYLSLQQSSTGADVLPAATAGVDTLEFAGGKINLVHGLAAASPLATTSSTVAKATSLAAIPTPCPVGQALSAMDAKGNAVICIPVAANSAASPLNVAPPSAAPFLYTYTQQQILAGDTITTSGTTLFASQATIPANTLLVGTVIELDASGTYNITTTQEPGPGMIWIRVGGIRVASTNYQTSLAMGNNYLWTVHFKAIIRSVGPGGTLDPLLTATSSSNQWGGTAELANFNPTQAVNTTAADAIQLELTDTFPSDSATIRQLTVTVR